VSPKKRVNASSRTYLLNKPRAAAILTTNPSQNSPKCAALQLVEKLEADLARFTVNLTRQADFTVTA
jgi:hypothetical protein